MAWSFVAMTRLGAFAFLGYRERTGTQTIEALPLVLLLYPEALILAPRSQPRASAH